MNEQTKAMNEQMKAMNAMWQENLEAGREQWTTWNSLWMEGARASMDAFMTWRESWGKMAAEYTDRAVEMSMDEQKTAMAWLERSQAQMGESLEQATKLASTLGDTGKQWTREAGMAMQEQAGLMQEQVEEWMTTANEVAEKATAKAPRTAKSTNGTKSAKTTK
jgi:hypothetical protein